MALSQQAVESMLQAMDIIAAKQFNSVSYDQTIICTIVDRSSASKEFFYTVTDGSAKFKAYVLSAQEAEEYDVDDQVYVKIPNGDYSKKKYIEGYYISEDTVVPIAYTSPLDTFLDMANLTSEGSQTAISEGLIANKTAAIPIWEWRIDDSSKNAADDLQANGIYDTLGLQADFKCLLNTYNMRAGSYGLRLDLYVRLSPKSTKHFVKSVYLDSSEMFGNPYAFTIFATQAKTFDISSIGTVDGMTLWFYQNDDFRYFNGKEEKRIEVYEGLSTPNIFVTNVYVAFGSEMAEVTDNTIKLYSTNDLSFNQINPTDVTNTKNLGFLWYNKTGEGKYIGFSDGLVDFKRNADGTLVDPIEIDPYDELEYLAYSAQDSRLVEQMGKDVPKDKNGLEVSASIAEAKDILKKSYRLIQADLVNTLKAFKERVNGLNIKQDDSYITAADYFTNRINIAKESGATLQAHTEKFMTWMNEALSAAAAIQKHQIDVTEPEEIKVVESENIYASLIEKFISQLATNFYSMVGDKREFLFKDLKESITANYSGFQSVYDTYSQKMDKIFTTLEENSVAIYALLNDAEERVTSSNDKNATSESGYQYILSKKIETYTQRDFSDYHNRYCIYWYRYKEGYVDSEGLMEDGWERIAPGIVFKDSSYSTTTIPANLGLSTGYTTEGGESYFLPKPTDEEGYLKIYLTPDLAKEKFRVVIYYNHERFDSEVLEFENLDPIVDKTTLDSNDAITIKHGINSADSYQTLYAQNNSLTNSRDASTLRGLDLEYNGVLGGNENLANAQIFWYVPRNATMLTVDANSLINNYDFATDYYRSAEVIQDVTARQGPGENYKETSDNYKAASAEGAADADIIQVYDQNNGWYSLRSSNNIGVNGRWVPASAISLRDNADVYMDGFACFYKTIPFTEEEVNVYDETDPEKVIGTKIIQVVDEKDLQFFYKIKDYYTAATALKNTIFCIVKKDDYEFETSISFIFGTQGTSGTDYTLIVTPSDISTSVVGDNIFPVHVKAYDYDNNEVPIYATTNALTDGTLYGPEVDWLGPSTFNFAIVKDEKESGIVNTGEISQLDVKKDAVINGKTQFNYCGVAKVTVNMYDTNYGNNVKQLAALYPIAWSAGDYYIEGANSIVYDSSGANPVYYKDSYRIFRTGTNEEMTDVTWDIKYFMLADVNRKGTPKYMFDKDGNIWNINDGWIEVTDDADLQAEVNFYTKYIPTLSAGNNKLVPCNNYITGTYDEDTKTWTDLNMYPVVCCYDESGTQIWAQPIAISQNRYPNSMINHWDGKLSIDEDNGAILSTMVGAGFKNTDNTFSGVLMGDIEAGSVSQDNKDGVGLYGYHHGVQSFGLNIDGTAFFGKSGRGRIKIDGNNGTITSASYEQLHESGDSGMLIDLDDGIIDMYGVDWNLSDSSKYELSDTRPHIRLSSTAVPNNPYFLITTPNVSFNQDNTNPNWVDKPLIYVGLDDYYLQSENYVAGSYSTTDGAQNKPGMGTKIDLQNGRLDAYNLLITSKNIYIDSTEGANPYFVIKDDHGHNLLYTGTEEYYLKTCDYKERIADAQGNTTTYGSGIKIDLWNNKIDAYNFMIRGESNSSTTGGSYILLDSSKPQFTVHLKNSSADLDLLHISPEEFMLHSSNWSTSISTDSTPVKTATCKSGYNVRSGPGTGYSIVGTTGSSSKTVTIYEDSTGEGSDIWYRIGENEWVAGGAISNIKTSSDGNKPVGSGMEINMNNGCITAYNSNNANKNLLIDASNKTYPIQLGTIGSYNLKLGWDGSLQGGTTYTWSINSSGKATFNSMTVNSGSFNGYIYASGGTIGGCTIKSGTISGSGWELSSSGAIFNGLKLRQDGTIHNLGLVKGAIRISEPVITDGSNRRPYISKLDYDSINYLVWDGAGSLPAGFSQVSKSVVVGGTTMNCNTRTIALNYVGYEPEEG